MFSTMAGDREIGCIRWVLLLLLSFSLSRECASLILRVWLQALSKFESNSIFPLCSPGASSYSCSCVCVCVCVHSRYSMLLQKQHQEQQKNMLQQHHHCYHLSVAVFVFCFWIHRRTLFFCFCTSAPHFIYPCCRVTLFLSFTWIRITVYRCSWVCVCVCVAPCMFVRHIRVTYRSSTDIISTLFLFCLKSAAHFMFLFVEFTVVLYLFVCWTLCFLY